VSPEFIEPNSGRPYINKLGPLLPLPLAHRLLSVWRVSGGHFRASFYAPDGYAFVELGTDWLSDATIARICLEVP
jgi:hypothetical protein